jgi:aminoglycoside phosphotransferase family enzyme
MNSFAVSDVVEEPPGIAAKVDFLSQPSNYPDPTEAVEVIETHMSWIFLTDRFAYKLKKPVRFEFLDFSTIAARRVDCYHEIRLNRRLAGNVYLSVVPIALDADNPMKIAGAGEPVEWLVQMRKLPRDRMLDHCISVGSVTDEEIEAVGRLLSKFYRQAPPPELSGSHYCHRLAKSIRATRFDLFQHPFGLRLQKIDSIANALTRFVQANHARLIQRVRDRRVIEAHGDLRPEHICLESPPVIIDCLEFSRDFRLLDTASEMSFLALECDRLGASEISRSLWQIYEERTGDKAAEDLRRFYRGNHALTRARISIAHLRDDIVREPGKWKPKAEHYLKAAAEAMHLET